VKPVHFASASPLVRSAVGESRGVGPARASPFRAAGTRLAPLGSASDPLSLLRMLRDRRLAGERAQHNGKYGGGPQPFCSPGNRRDLHPYGQSRPGGGRKCREMWGWGVGKCLRSDREIHHQIYTLMQTILGANGVIGHELSRALPQYADRIRCVSRAPRPVNPTDEAFVADLLDAKATERAVAGSGVAYLVAGLKYDLAVWQEQWPRIMRNVIDACQRHGTRLVFFDNVYAYGRVDGAMTEETPFNPSSRKGEVRAKVARMLLEEIRAGSLQAMIVRAADFYGPGAEQSFPHATVFERLRADKTPQWIGDPKAVHTFTYTPDAGRATAALGQSDEAYGKTWHLPTSREPITGEGFVRLACERAGRPFKLQVAPRWMLRLMGLFNPVLRENDEMMYQFEHDYRFDSSKVEAAYGLEPTSYRDGIAETLANAR